ncbi:MAG: preprotein translocase subunit SecY [Lachnospiraceae bacterium]|nr:preprotein translocase subunit SecY [Lachnospiraceae bacterium]MBQ6637431.1 preprotein translocase subunit SecY [Lachnospiraceae bacterium]MBR3638250.1 preprotein translocase subunit SecY [Lachnospiraceae bacterium]
MFKTFINAFKIKDIRKKLLYTLLILVVIRIGSQIPIPGVNIEYVKQMMETILGGGDGGIFMAITGGSLERMSILALGITPYITSSIVMQLLTIAIPGLEEMQRDGEDGRKKIAAITRYLTVALALIESGAMAIGYKQILNEYNALSVITVIAAMTAGSAFLMWLGERVTENGVGNGISIVLVINIISTFPQDAVSLYTKFVKGQTVATAILNSVIIIVVVLGLVVMVIYLSDAIRKIPIQYAKKIQGNKMMGGNSSHIPVRVNTAGVIPVIFAASLLQFPIIISNMVGFNAAGEGWLTKFWAEALNYMNSSHWFNTADMKYTLGILIYIVLVVFFAYFYTSITFNPAEIANNLKKAGGFVPGIRPGKPTSEYLNSVLNYIIFIGAVGLVIVAIIPYVFNGLFGASVSFGGTSIIIVVSVVIETAQQVESQMLVRNYKGFLND